MPVRIYKLAQELKFDSKELVDLCVKAGIPGKGSALASLDDDEVDKLKNFLANRNKPKRPEIVEHTPPPVLPPTPRPAPPPAPSPAPPLAPSAAPAVAPPVRSEPEVAPPPPAPAVATPASSPLAGLVGGKAPPPAAPAPAPPVAAALGGAASSPPAPVRRELPSGPLAGSGGRIRVLGSSRRKTDEGKKPDAEGGGTATAPKPSSKRESQPVVRLGAIPQTKQPTVEKKADEPSQKPIMKLPKDAIRSAQAGAAAPLQEFTRQQDRKRTAAPGAPKKPGTPGAPGPVEEPVDAKGRRRGPKTTEVVADEGGNLKSLASAREARQQQRKRVNTTSLLAGDDEDRPARRRPRKINKSGPGPTTEQRKSNVTLQVPCTVRQFSEAAGVGVSQVLKALMALQGTLVNINFILAPDVAEYLAAEFGIEVEFKQQESLEQQLITGVEESAEDPDNLVARPPIVTFLGHVDHGKTSLLDRIIGTKLVAGEAGGITQHIRAYQVEKDGKKISFVDTPGHEAFTEMRARGANVTDIAVLVVAADDGVMPQTEEAISHARAAKVPIVVAMNKIDLPTADETRVLQGLAAQNLLATEWGGDVEVIRTSATTGKGIDQLLETLLVTAELHEYKANPNRPAQGTCLEAEQQGKLGVVAKVMVQNGTLRVGDVLVCGATHGRVKAMYDTRDGNKRIEEAGPSTPINLTGLDAAPAAGDRFHVLDDIAQAREIAEQRSAKTRARSLSGYKAHVSFEEFQSRRSAGQLGNEAEVAILNIILRADTRGSIEAIEKELGKLDHPEVKVNVLQATVGGVTVGDVTLADASDAVILGFNVIPDEAARQLAEQRGVEIRRYDIIYKLTEDIRAVLEGKLKPEERVKEMGRALVQKVFVISRVGAVAGCRVLQGTIDRGCRIRVNRESRGIGEYALESLKREKDDAREVREGLECGIKLSGFNDLKEGDILEAFKIEEVARTL